MPFKSYWYYWYTGHKFVAVASMIITALITGLSLVIVANFSLWGVIIAVLLDAAGLWLIALYFLMVRFELPTFLHTQGDTFVMQNLVVPVIVSVIVGRLVTFVVAKIFMQPLQ